MSKARRVTDPVHGSIELTAEEWAVVDTPAFQRLRQIKQLQFGHVTYPNATHSRFAHCLGVAAVMQRVVDAALRGDKLTEAEGQELRLAGLLHDIGHYPYSHLLEGVDNVRLTEERVEARELTLTRPKYPDHEEVGRILVTTRDDILKTVGGPDRAKRIADLFTRAKSANPQLSKLIHSSLDMDRLDYLVRDASACGVPYGEIDLNYLMGSFRVSPSGMIGIDYKAATAAEHFLLARMFMHRAVYFHKTTYGFEEACRQLLRRCRDAGRHDIPPDGNAVREIAQSPRILGFVDSFVDDVIRRAASDESDAVTSALANCLLYRRPPKLIREVSGYFPTTPGHNDCTHFVRSCEDRLRELAKTLGVRLELFLLAEPKPVTLEKRAGLLTAEEARKIEEEEKDELIKVFVRGKDEPVSLVDEPNGFLRSLAGHSWRMVRLYLVSDDETVVNRAREEVARW